MNITSIIFILPDLEMGGAERVICTIANHLPRDKFSPKLLLLRKEGAYLDYLKNDVEVIDLKINRIRHSIFPILAEIHKRKPDIIFCGFGEVNAYLSLFIPLFPKTKFIARETNVVSKHVTRREIRFFYRYYNNFHKIICQSDDMLKDLSENFKVKAEKLIKINNPVDFNFIQEKLKNAEKPACFSAESKNVVAIGNLSARKGFDNLLKVFTYLKNENIKLHILGAGRDAEHLQKIKNEWGLTKVLFHGKQENPFKFLNFADLFVLSSRYEGFPNVLLEAGACGTYSLANNCKGGISEIIETGINGEICNIENHQQFAENLMGILSSKHDGERVKNSIKSRFSKEIILKQYQEILENF